MADEFEEPKTPDANGVYPGQTSPSSEVNPQPAAYSSSSDPYGVEPPVDAAEPGLTPVVIPPAPLPVRQEPPTPPPPPTEDEEEEDDEERGMLRMSFMEHLEELRSRLLKSIAGVLVAFMASIIFCKDLWRVVSAPAVTALTHLGVHPPNLAQITPMEQFNVIYLKLPLLVSVFVGSPWVLYQVWAFISPGLYQREKKWAVPFVVSTAGLFITGGSFAYFVAFRYGLEFLLGIGRDVNITPVVSINEYFDLFVNVTLGVGLVFEMPVIIFFLTLLRLASPRFLLKHSRYAILAITVIAAVVTPTPDIFNMMLFAVPMVALFFVGVFASYLLVMKREGRKFPWITIILVALGLALAAGGSLALLVYRYHYHFLTKWPYITK